MILVYLIYLSTMIFSQIKESIDAAIPLKAPSGAEKIKLGYFKRLWVGGIYGDLIKLNDGRVLIYRVTGTDTYIFDPKDDSFKRTAVTNSPSFFDDRYDKGYNYHYNDSTKAGVTLKNGKVLILNPPLKNEISEIDYYNMNIHEEQEREILHKYYKNKTLENEENAKTYVKQNKPELYAKYLKFKEYQEDAKHAHLYNPETGLMEQIDIPPIRNYDTTYKLLLNDGRVLIIENNQIIKLDPTTNKKIEIHPHKAAIYDPVSNKFTKLPDNHKVTGHFGYIVLSTGDIFIFDWREIPYLYNILSDTLHPKKGISSNDGYFSDTYIKLKDDTICFLNSPSKKSIKSKIVCYNPYTEKVVTMELYNEHNSQILQIMDKGNILITGKNYDAPFNYRTGSENRPDYHVEVYTPETNEVKLLSKKTNTTLSDDFSQSVLLNDGRILFRNTDSTVDDYELFIPYSYIKQKKAEQKQLKKQQNKK